MAPRGRARSSQEEVIVAKTVKASYPGHVLTRPATWTAPFVFASPHSGRQYPSRFLSSACVELADLRRSEDAYVDALLPRPDSIGVPLLSARFPRAFVDVNRTPFEIDNGMFASPPFEDADVRSNRVLAGFGMIPRLAAAGRQIYARRLPAQEARARLRFCYEPYHEALRDLVDDAIASFGSSIVIDWHSMPSTSASGRSLPDIVLGDRHGTSCAPELIDGWHRAFKAAGFSVARNTPYAGGYVTALHGDPAQHRHALQVEINRGLYLDETRVLIRPAAFESLERRLRQVVGTMIGAYEMPLDWAAE